MLVFNVGQVGNLPPIVNRRVNSNSEILRYGPIDNRPQVTNLPHTEAEEDMYWSKSETR